MSRKGLCPQHLVLQLNNLNHSSEGGVFRKTNKSPTCSSAKGAHAMTLMGVISARASEAVQPQPDCGRKKPSFQEPQPREGGGSVTGTKPKVSQSPRRGPGCWGHHGSLPGGGGAGPGAAEAKPLAEREVGSRGAGARIHRRGPERRGGESSPQTALAGGKRQVGGVGL